MQIELAVHKHRADRQVREQREWLRVILNSIGDAVIATDGEGRIGFLNPVAESLTGWKAEEATGRRVTEVFRVVNEQTGHPLEEPVARVLREGRTAPLADHAALVTRDGRTVPIEDSAAPILDAAGQVIGVVLVFHDVTGKRRAEEEPRKSEEKFRTGFANATVGFAITTPAGRFVDANPAYCRLTGYSSDELRDIALSQLVHPDDQADNIPRIDRMPAGEITDFVVENRYIRKDRQVVWVRKSVSPVRTSDGALQWIIMLVEDVTEQHRREQLLLEQNRILELVAAGRPLGECLEALTGSVTRLHTDARAAVVTANEAREAVERAYSEHIPSSFGQGIAGARIEELAIGSCARAMFEGSRIVCDDIAADERWSQAWRDLCAAHGIRAAHSTPIFGHDGAPVAAFFMVSGQARQPSEWELGLADFGARMAAVVLQRDRDSASLRKSEERYRALFENMTEGFALHEIVTDEQGRPVDYRFLEVNPAFERLTGLERADLIGKRVLEVLPGTEAHWIEKYGRVALTGEPAHFEDHSAVLGRWYEVLAYRTAPRQFAVVFTDVGERKAAEEALRQSESGFRLLSETAGQLLATQDPQGIVDKLCKDVMDRLDCHVFFNFLVDEPVGRLHLNACAGIPDEEARRIEWLDYGVAVCGCVAQAGERIVAEDIFHTPDIRTELVKSYGIQAYACHPLMVQGKLIGTLSFGTRTRPHFSPGDLALMKTVTDQVASAMQRMKLIEELRHSRDGLELRVRERTAELQTYMQKLQESNLALQEFASIASHDMQEPLRKVRAFGSRLSDRCGSSLGDEGKQYLARMLNAAERMQSLLTSLLDYSRVTTKAEPFRPVDLGVVVKEVLSDLEVRIEKTGGEVLVGELPTLHADPTQMRQLFQNLIGNGLKFHKDGERPVVKVHCFAKDLGCCEITVEDNGIGFEEQYMDRIFAPFQRLHGRSSQYEGAGMGLAICKRIVERHGGSIRANSTEGEGSVFIIDLPARQAGSKDRGETSR